MVFFETLLRNKWKVVFFIFVGFVLIQLVPYGRTHENPPVVKEPDWDSEETRVLVARTCFDCHSNDTVWPWYSHIAPISWLVQHDVEEGRAHLNFSEWHLPQRHADESAEEVEEGEMPIWVYELTHSEARLNETETAKLIEGLRKTLDNHGKAP